MASINFIKNQSAHLLGFRTLVKHLQFLCVYLSLDHEAAVLWIPHSIRNSVGEPGVKALPMILALGRLKQEDHGFKTKLATK